MQALVDAALVVEAVVIPALNVQLIEKSRQGQSPTGRIREVLSRLR
jgi:hypothetical protein